MLSAPADSGQLTILTDHLLVQAGPADLDVARRLADQDGSGLVLTGERAVELCRARWRDSFSRPLLADRRRYAGRARSRGTDRLTDSWLSGQQAAGVAAVLSDSGYIGEGDEESLTSVLSQSARAGAAVVAVLPLHISWLGNGLKKLTAEVNEHDIPVALVLEHKDDPLGTRRAVKGLIDFLAGTEVPVSMLCCDISALSALAFGADWAAVGVRSGLRHLYPSNGRSGFGRGPSVSALVRPMLSIVTVEKIGEAWAATHEDPEWVHDIWTCACRTCGGRTLEWLAWASEAEANAHTFELLAELRDGLAGLTASQDRQRSWTSKCNMAVNRYDELRLDSRVGWRVPGYLRSWAALWKR
jgi:hypothetical protein